MSANVESFSLFLPSQEKLLLTVSVSVPFSLLLDKGKTILYPEIRDTVGHDEKETSLGKSRPDSAISAKMYLSVHRHPSSKSKGPQRKVSACKSRLTCPQGWRT